MALTIINPGQYVLGGIDAPQTGIAEQFQAGLRANLDRQDAQQAMKVRDQEMQLRAAQEARAQAAFKQQQAAAARAATRSAGLRNAEAEYRNALRTGAPGTPTTDAPAAGVRITPTARPRTMYDAPTGQQLPSDVAPSFGQPSVTPQTIGLTLPSSGVMSAQDGQTVMQGGVGADRLDGSQVAAEVAAKLEDPTLSPEERRALGIQQNVLGFAARTGYGVVDAVTDAAALLQRIGTRAIEYGVGAPLSAVSPGLGASVFRRVEEWDRTADELARMGETVPSRFLSQSLTDATGIEPISKETAEAEATGVVPIVETPWGGVQFSYGTPVQEAAAETNGKPSTKFAMAPELLALKTRQLEEQKFRTEALLDFYDRTGNTEAFASTMTELNNLEVEQWFMGGMNAIVGMQTGDFGPLLGLMQERYAGREVDVRPYTDNTVDIFVDGEVLTGANGGRMTWDELATSLQGQYDTVYIQNQQAAAQAAANLDLTAAEAEIEATKQIAIEQAKAQFGATTTVDALDPATGIYAITEPGKPPRVMRLAEMENTGEFVLLEVGQAPGQ